MESEPAALIFLTLNILCRGYCVNILSGVYCTFMDTTLSPIAITLREAREAAGLTQVQLAERADVRQATISELETGKTRRVDLDVLDRLCHALRVEPGELLRRTGRRAK